MLLVQVDRYLRATRTAPARFGRDAVGDPNFVFDLQDGRMPREKTVARVLAFIEKRQEQGSSAKGGSCA